MNQDDDLFKEAKPDESLKGMSKEEVKQIYALLLTFEKTKDEECLKQVFDIWHPYTLEKELVGNEIVMKQDEPSITYESFKQSLLIDGCIHTSLFFCCLPFYCDEKWLTFNDSDIQTYSNIQELSPNTLLIKLL